MGIYEQFKFNHLNSDVGHIDSLFDNESFYASANIINEKSADPFISGILQTDGHVVLRSKVVNVTDNAITNGTSIKALKSFVDSSGTSRLYAVEATTKDMFTAQQDDTDWVVVTGGTDVWDGATAGLVFKDFSDDGVPTLLFKWLTQNKQLYYISVAGGTSTLNAVASVFGAVLGIYDQRSWLTEYSTAGSGGKSDRVFYSDIGDQETYGATSYFQVGTRGYTLWGMQEFEDNFFIFSANECYKWDTYQLRKEFNLGIGGVFNSILDQQIAVAGKRMFFINRSGNSNMFEFNNENEPMIAFDKSFIKNQTDPVQIYGRNNELYVNAGGTAVIKINTENGSSVCFNDPRIDTNEDALFYPEYFTQGDEGKDLYCAFGAQAYAIKNDIGNDEYSGADKIGILVTKYIYGNNTQEISITKNWREVDIFYNVSDDTLTTEKIDIYYNINKKQRFNQAPYESLLIDSVEVDGLIVNEPGWKLLGSIRSNDFNYNFKRFSFIDSAQSRQIRLKFVLTRGTSNDSVVFEGFRLYYDLKPFEQTK